MLAKIVNCSVLAGFLAIGFSTETIIANTQLSESCKRPNILFIFADDWGWGDLSCHGHSTIKTPNIDRLAQEGTDFHRFSVASGVCSPSRTAIMTGHFPARYNIDGHFAWVPSNAKRNMPDWLSPQAPLLSRLLQEAGYATGHFGKWHLSNDMIPDSPPPSQYCFTRSAAFNCSGPQMPVHDDAKLAIEFIKDSHAKQTPFFINLWLHEPHTPFHTLPKYREQFANLPKEENIYASVLAHADERIGDVLHALDELQLSNNTLVIFSSDNGPARAATPIALKKMVDTATGEGFNIAASKGTTGGRKGYKAALYQGGVCVPFIARWPGKIKAGRIDKTTMLSAVDLLPTFCELAAAQMPEGYHPDGLSQVQALLGQGSTIRSKPLFWKMQARWPAAKQRPYHWASYAIVHKEWKLLSNRDGSYCELFDLVIDPLETRNVTSTHPQVAQRLLQQINNWKSTLPKMPTGDVFSKLRNQSVSETEK